MTAAKPASLAVREPGRKTVRSESRKRTEMVGVRFTTDEKAALTAAAEARGMTVPDYLRLCFEAAQIGAAAFACSCGATRPEDCEVEHG